MNRPFNRPSHPTSCQPHPGSSQCSITNKQCLCPGGNCKTTVFIGPQRHTDTLYFSKETTLTQIWQRRYWERGTVHKHSYFWNCCTVKNMTVHWNFVFTQIYSGQNNFECCKKLYVILDLLLAVLGHLGTIICDYNYYYNNKQNSSWTW